MRVRDLGELALVRALRAILDQPHPDVPVGNGDDAAVWQPRGAVAVTVDSVVEGVDWLPEQTPPEAIGHRAGAVSLSDLAAMGAQPGVLVLALEVPGDAEVDAILAGARGLRAVADAHGAVVVGGDVGVSPGPQRWSVTALGAIQGQAMCRNQVNAGDQLWLVGAVGQAALGLAVLKAGHPGLPHLTQAHLWPQPRVAAGLALQAAGVRACIDVSDGLALDAGRLAAASGIDLIIDLPPPAWLTDDLAVTLADVGLDWRAACASGGDDYALLCAAPDGLDVAAIVADAQPIGRAHVGPGQVTVTVAGIAQQIRGWLH